MEKLSFSIPRVVEAKKALLSVGQISVLILFWATALNNLNLLLPIICLSILYIAIFKDILLSFIGILFGIVVASVLLKFNFVQSFFENKDVKYIYFFIALIELAIIPAILFSINTRANLFDNSIKEFVFSLFLVLALQLLLRVNNQNDDELSLRYLVPTGEDNASWLSGLGAGMRTEPDKSYYTSQVNSGAGNLTGLFSLVSRGLIGYGEQDFGYVNNLSILLRIYMVSISLAILFIGLTIFRKASELKVGAAASYSISLIAGFSVYVSATSSAVYGHLPPIQSGLVTFLLIAYLSSIVSERNLKFISSNFVRHLLIIALLLGISEAWLPLAPAVVLAVTILLARLVLTNFPHKYREIGKFLIISISGLLIIFYSVNTDLQIFVHSKLDTFTILVHYVGGTLNPNNVQIIAFTIFILLYSNNLIGSFTSSPNSHILKILLTSFLAFYAFVIARSITTPPNSIDYAGQKLGLFLAFVTLPLSLSAFGFFMLRRSHDLLSSSSLIVSTFILLFFLGPPSGPSTPSYVQFGSPFGFIDILQKTKESNSNWKFQLINQIKDSPNKTVICFDSRQQDFDVADGFYCSKFALAIQGKWGYDSFSWFWTRVNMNQAKPEDWEDNVPENFSSLYKIFRLDENFESSKDPNQMEFAKYFPLQEGSE